MDELFELDWQKEWTGMPEFVQEKDEPFAMLRVRFRSKEDLDDFAERLGQSLTPRTKSIWHPALVKTNKQLLRWRDVT
tara:strand:+ start:409 stop:642 length:234 start_codon:yes stop_codon:yes gene_type:complete